MRVGFGARAQQRNVPSYFCGNAGGHTSKGVDGDLNAEGLKPLLRLPVAQLQAKPDKSDDRPRDSKEVA